MRHLILALIALVLATPAQAGLRAVYGSSEQARTLVIEVADNGDARIGEAGDAGYGLLLGSHFYIVSRQGDGWMAARIEDVAAAIDRVMPPIFGDVLIRAGPAAPRAKMRAERKGEATVGGRAGTVWAVHGLGGDTDAKPADYVMSRDADLAPVGRALEQFMHASLIPGAPLMGSAAAELIEETRYIFALGTPIDVGGRFRLQTVAKAEVAPERFALPVKPSTADELAAQMQARVPTR